MNATTGYRRGLPRVRGGEPWPDFLVAADPHTPVPAAGGPTSDSAESAIPVDVTVLASPGLRRGLPRVSGGEPWPPEGWQAPEAAASRDFTNAVDPTETLAEQSASVRVEELPRELEGANEIMPSPSGHADAPISSPSPNPEQGPGKPPGPNRVAQKLRLPALALAAGIVAVGLIFLARWLVTLDAVAAFMRDYPGEYNLPEPVAAGFPAWVGWQHFLNAFLLVLIIRSGIQVRREQRPSAYWTGKRAGSRKISLMLWFHLSLDLVWLLNGALFIVLLFASGHWMRIVPTSLEVFPNAVSALLHYLSLNWPTENGWVNYNSLQQLAYFTTVFIASPLAATTGVRMSAFWPKDSARLNAFYPIEAARAVHFPVMIYFVVFIVTHVFLVLATGALRNLNHMYAGQDGEGWAGVWIFTASLVVIVGAAWAARPSLLAPIASLNGTVSSR